MGLNYTVKFLYKKYFKIYKNQKKTSYRITVRGNRSKRV